MKGKTMTPPTRELLVADYVAAQKIYSTAPPAIIGRFTLSQQQAEALPLSLNEIYQTAQDAIAEMPAKAQIWARTFGMLSVNVALSSVESSFSFDNVTDFKPAGIAEIATTQKQLVTDTFYATEIDGALAYILANDQPVKTEMALIQALHLLDAAIVTGQYDAQMPLLLSADSEELSKLKADNPDVFLRLYGNSRNRADNPLTLGTVVPSTMLERSGISTQSFSAMPAISVPAVNGHVVQSREKANFIGITTAKRPHVGHGFLLLKALAEAGQSEKVLVELNDQGPRVARALAVLAKQYDEPLEQIAQRVSDGEIKISEVERAYRARASVDQPPDYPDFSLKQSNDYYRTVLSGLMPEQTVIVADSELPSVKPGLDNMSASKSLFNKNSGMTLLRNGEGKAVVTVNEGRLSVAGILATLSTKYELRLVDSPPPLSVNERAIFSDCGLSLDQTPGMGVMIDFTVSSATAGDTILIDELTKMADGKPERVLPALRAVLNNAYFLPSDAKSLSPNFASKQVVIDAYKRALLAGIPYKEVYKPMKFVDITRQLFKGLFLPSDMHDVKGKPTYQEVQAALKVAPVLSESFSDELLQEVLSKEFEGVIPKGYLSEADRKLIQALRSGKPDVMSKLLLQLAEECPTSFAAVCSGSEMERIAQAMGYSTDDMSAFIAKIKTQKGVYKLQ